MFQSIKYKNNKAMTSNFGQNNNRKQTTETNEKLRSIVKS